MMERKLAGRRTSSKLPALIDFVSAGMVTRTLNVTPQAARRTVGELDLCEMTGREGFGRGAFCSHCPMPGLDLTGGPMR